MTSLRKQNTPLIGSWVWFRGLKPPLIFAAWTGAAASGILIFCCVTYPISRLEVLAVSGFYLISTFAIFTLYARLLSRACDRTLHQVRRADAQINAIFDYAPHMIVVKEAKDLRITRVNKAGELLLGYSSQEIVDRDNRWKRDDSEKLFIKSRDRVVLELGRMEEILEEKVTTRSGETRYLHTRKIPLTDGEGISTQLLDVSEDITDIKLAEDKVRLLLEHTSEYVCIVDAKGKILQINSALERALGYFSMELSGKHVLELIHQDDRKASIPFLSGISDGHQTSPFDHKMICRDGTTSQITWRAVAHQEGRFILLTGHDAAKPGKAADIITEPVQEKELDRISREWNDGMARMLNNLKKNPNILKTCWSRAPLPRQINCVNWSN